MRIGRKCRLIYLNLQTYTRTNQNNDYKRTMHKIQFRSSFNRVQPQQSPEPKYTENITEKS